MWSGFVFQLNFGTTDTNKIRAGKERDLADVHLVGLPKSDAIQVTGLVYELDNTVPYCDRKPGKCFHYVSVTAVRFFTTAHLSDHCPCANGYLK